MYRCETCGQSVGPGVTRLVHRLFRQDKSIAIEYAVCPACHAKLASGVGMLAVMLRNNQDRLRRKALARQDIYEVRAPAPKRVTL